MKIRVVINEPYTGIESGWPLRYVNLIKELGALAEVRVFLPGGAALLRNDLGVGEVFEASSSPRKDPPARGLLPFLKSLLRPNSKNIVLSDFSRYEELDRLLGRDSCSYDAELYFHLSAYVHYARHRKASTIVCDICDSKLRSLAAQRRNCRTLRSYGSTLLAELYVKTIKRRLLPKNVIIAAITDDDSVFIQKVLPKNRIVTIPNGVSLNDHFLTLTEVEAKWSSKIAIFVGNLDYEPNIDAVIRILRMWPKVLQACPQARLWIVGRRPSADLAEMVLSSSRVELFRDVPSVRPFLEQATVSINPMFLGAGMKNKILEALAAGTPIVATSRAVSGIGLENGRHGYFGPREEDLINGTKSIFQMDWPEYRQHSSDCENLSKQYGWDVAARRLYRALDDSAASYEKTLP